MCGPIKEENVRSGNLSVGEGGAGVCLTDDVFMDDMDRGADGGASNLEDIGAVLNVGGAGATVCAKSNCREGGEGATMDTDGGNEVDNSHISMEEVVNIMDDTEGDDKGHYREGGGEIGVGELANVSENNGAEVEVKEDVGEDVGGGNEMGGGGDEVGANGSPVVPLPLIPRWRLREILAHAEGKCSCVVLRV